jgi:hypothetical protein
MAAVERERLHGAAFAGLIDELAKIARDAGGKEPDTAELTQIVSGALGFFRAFSDDDFRPSPLRKYARPIADVLELLRREEHQAELISILHPTVMTAEQRHDERLRARDQELARLRLAAMIRGLEQLERPANMVRCKRERGRPGDEDLWLLVHNLASIWAAATGKPFTQLWHDKVSSSPGARFVEAAVRFLDPGLLPALPKMTERVVADRRRGKRWATWDGGISGVTSG